MAAKLIFLVGVLGVGGYVGHKISTFDPTLMPYSKDQVAAKLETATTTLPRRDGDGQIKIWSAGRTSKGVELNMRYAAGAPLLTCEAVITEVAPNQARVVPDCGVDPNADAISRTTDELNVPMFEEHIRSTLEGRPFDRNKVDLKEAGTVMRNMDAMNREAMRRSDEEQRFMAETDK